MFCLNIRSGTRLIEDIMYDPRAAIRAKRKLKQRKRYEKRSRERIADYKDDYDRQIRRTDRIKKRKEMEDDT